MEEQDSLESCQQVGAQMRTNLSSDSQAVRSLYWMVQIQDY